MDKVIKIVEKALEKANIAGVDAHKWRDSVILTGSVDSWMEKINAGFAAAKCKKFKGVVNDIVVKDLIQDEPALPDFSDSLLEGKHFDVAIIGGGITGSAIARELSRFDIKIALLEKEVDLAKHASSRNDGMIHPGMAAKPGTKKAFYNVRGNAAYTQVTEDLSVPFQRFGSVLLFTSPFSRLLYPLLEKRALQNGVPPGRYLTNKEIREMEPHIKGKIYGGMFMETAGQLSPYQLTIAYAENAVENGARVFLNTAVLGLEKKGKTISTIKTNRGNLTAGVVVNAAGVWADRIAGYAADRFFSLHYRKGTDLILDLKSGKAQNHIVVRVPLVAQMKTRTKGGGVIPTVEGNILVGPTAEEQPFRERYNTEEKDMEFLFNQMSVNEKFTRKDVITYFAGIRACTYEEDFIIEPSEHVDNLVHVAGIQSPGLASAPAIAEDVSKMCVEILNTKSFVPSNKSKKSKAPKKEVQLNVNFNPVRQNVNPELRFMPENEREALIKKNPAYGHIVCRCEEISEGEIRDALRSPVPATTLNGIKRRARAGTGRCQGGFCSPAVMEIMAEELNVDITAICKKGGNSQILLGESKGDIVYNEDKLLLPKKRKKG
ncbi:MAG: NAD(P)/FAD-dependent oxidoreductase [bacterium]|nr:NAD(P)/FAD-dependent oxidoreductase [bacterium]